MNLKLRLGLSLLALSINGFAQGSERGGHDGGGGNGVVCYNSVGAINSVELLDFYEGRILEGHNIPHSESDYKAIFFATAKKYKSFFNSYTEKDTLESFPQNFRFLPAGTRLKPIDDANSIFIPSNCKIEQIANFQGISRIFIVSDFWNKMSETDKAGLLVHELIWYFERSNGVKYSARARRTVSRLFSDNFDGLRDNQELITDSKKWPLVCISLNSDLKTTNHFFMNSKTCQTKFLTINGEISTTAHELSLTWDPSDDYLCKATTQIFFRPTEPFEINGIQFNSMVHKFNIISTGDNLKTHQLIVDWNPERKGNELFLSMENLEFPGYNTKNDKVRCFVRDFSSQEKR